MGGGGRGAVGVSVDAAVEGWSGIYTCAPRHSVKRQLTAATRPLVQLPLVLPVSPVIQGAAHDPLDICLPLSPGCFVSPCPTLLCAFGTVFAGKTIASAFPLFRFPPQARHFALTPTHRRPRESKVSVPAATGPHSALSASP